MNAEDIFSWSKQTISNGGQNILIASSAQEKTLTTVSIVHGKVDAEFSAQPKAVRWSVGLGQPWTTRGLRDPGLTNLEAGRVKL